MKKNSKKKSEKKEIKTKYKADRKEIAANYKSQKKKALIAGAVLAVFLIVSASLFIAFNVSQPFFTKVTVALMPESLDYTDSDGKDITFYIEENKKFDATKDQPMDAYTVYYYKDDKKVVLDGGVYMTDKEFAESKRADLNGSSTSKIEGDAKYRIGVGEQVTVGFLTKAMEKANTVKTIIGIIMAAFIISCIALLIYIWYIKWAIKYDLKEKQLADAEKKNQKKSDDE